MLGPPGAGKGTQAEQIARSRGIPRISTGDALRGAVRAGTPVGLRAQAAMDRGELVSDDVVIDIVRERLGRPDTARGFVLDGFPRTVGQAEALDRILAGRGLLVIVDIEVPEPELIRRLEGRRVCESCGANADALGDWERAGAAGAPVFGQATERCGRCGGAVSHRADDDEVVVRERMKVYGRDMLPLLAYYGSRASFRSVDGAQPPAEVARDLSAAIASVLEPVGVRHEARR